MVSNIELTPSQLADVRESCAEYFKNYGNQAWFTAAPIAWRLAAEDIIAYVNEIERLRAREAELRSVLEWYADSANWFAEKDDDGEVWSWSLIDGPPGNSFPDRGSRAKAALLLESVAGECLALSSAALSKLWNTPEEEAAWAALTTPATLTNPQD